MMWVFWRPYTLELDANTKRFTPWRRQASSVCSVPVALTEWVSRGEETDVGTRAMAARWYTQSAPASAGSSRSGSSTLPTSRRAPAARSSSAPPALAGPDRSSTTVTRSPRFNSASVKWRPMNPLPPVTTDVVMECPPVMGDCRRQLYHATDVLIDHRHGRTGLRRRVSAMLATRAGFFYVRNRRRSLL